MIIKIERVVPGHPLPERATTQSACFDAFAAVKNRSVTIYTQNNGEFIWNWGHVVIDSGQRARIPLGFRTELSLDCEAELRPRSGLALKNGITLINAPGTIDSDFRDEWCALLINHSSVPFIVEDGDRICQIAFRSYESTESVPILREVHKVEPAPELHSGFGSTGV